MGDGVPLPDRSAGQRRLGVRCPEGSRGHHLACARTNEDMSARIARLRSGLATAGAQQ